MSDNKMTDYRNEVAEQIRRNLTSSDIQDTEDARDRIVAALVKCGVFDDTRIAKAVEAETEACAVDAIVYGSDYDPKIKLIKAAGWIEASEHIAATLRARTDSSAVAKAEQPDKTQDGSDD